MFKRTLQIKLAKPNKKVEQETQFTTYVPKAKLSDYEYFTKNIVKEIGKGVALCIVLHGVTKVAVALAER